jgi:hypothetical protein
MKKLTSQRIRILHVDEYYNVIHQSNVDVIEAYCFARSDQAYPENAWALFEFNGPAYLQTMSYTQFIEWHDQQESVHWWAE